MSAPVLYVDMGSPYAYLAVERAEEVLGAMPRIEPVALGAIFKHRGFGSWAETGRRAEHVAEIERRAAAYGLPPVRWPDGWPMNSLHADRCVVWADRHGLAAQFARAGLRAWFAEGRDYTDHDVLRDVAASVGLPADELDAAIAAEDLQLELRERTATAIAASVPGVPTLRVGDALFYGDDRLEEAAAAVLA